MREVVRDIIWLPAHRPSPRDIVHHVAMRRALLIADLRGRSRAGKIAKARHEAMWELRNRTSLSLPQIAKMLNRKDHTTALNGIRRHEQRLAAQQVAA